MKNGKIMLERLLKNETIEVSSSYRELKYTAKHKLGEKYIHITELDTSRIKGKSMAKQKELIYDVDGNLIYSYYSANSTILNLPMYDIIGYGRDNISMADWTETTVYSYRLDLFLDRTMKALGLKNEDLKYYKLED